MTAIEKSTTFSICDYCPDEKKTDFEFLAFSLLYYINKDCMQILWQYLKYFSKYGHFIY